MTAISISSLSSEAAEDVRFTPFLCLSTLICTGKLLRTDAFSGSGRLRGWGRRLNDVGSVRKQEILDFLQNWSCQELSDLERQWKRLGLLQSLSFSLQRDPVAQ